MTSIVEFLNEYLARMRAEEASLLTTQVPEGDAGVILFLLVNEGVAKVRREIALTEAALAGVESEL